MGDATLRLGQGSLQVLADRLDLEIVIREEQEQTISDLRNRVSSLEWTISQAQKDDDEFAARYYRAQDTIGRLNDEVYALREKVMRAESALRMREHEVTDPKNKIPMIKFVRTVTGVGLKEAKDMVDKAIEEGRI